jgi:hypothetical protein
MSWRARNVDLNHRDICEALRAVGASVTALIRVGDGCPDLLVGYRDETFLLEVKRPLGARGGTSRSKLEESQEEWIGSWRGRPVAIVRSPDEALEAIGARVSPNRVPAPLVPGTEPVAAQAAPTKRQFVPRRRKRLRMGPEQLEPVQAGA